jgi:hypothetical protein
MSEAELGWSEAFTSYAAFTRCRGHGLAAVTSAQVLSSLALGCGSTFLVGLGKGGPRMWWVWVLIALAALLVVVFFVSRGVANCAGRRV